MAAKYEHDVWSMKLHQLGDSSSTYLTRCRWQYRFENTPGRPALLQRVAHIGKTGGRSDWSSGAGSVPWFWSLEQAVIVKGTTGKGW